MDFIIVREFPGTRKRQCHHEHKVSDPGTDSLWRFVYGFTQKIQSAPDYSRQHVVIF